MAEFLSAEWVAALSGLLRAGEVRTDDGPPLVIQQLVEHPDGTTSAYEIRLGSDGAEATVGLSEERSEGSSSGATVLYRQSYEVARGIASGELDAHVEFLMGRVVVSGDTKALAEHRGALERLTAALATMRETTEF